MRITERSKSRGKRKTKDDNERQLFIKEQS